MRVVLAVAVLAACDTGAKPTKPPPAVEPAKPVVEPAKPPAPPASVDLAVHMERTQCYGSCPAYKLDIAADGTVTFKGEDFTAAKHGTRHISADRLRALSELIDAAKFFDLRDKYVSEGCKSVWT